ncbi:MAG: hypothetical protein ACREU1_12600 [Burkholderiales bacterium]
MPLTHPLPPGPYHDAIIALVRLLDRPHLPELEREAIADALTALIYFATEESPRHQERTT